jgi:hypothetical protein
MELKIESRIDGECKGWEGKTLFKFINGQIWEQAVNRYRYFYKYRPVARIWANGSQYLLEIEGVNEKLPVRKVK